MGLLATLAGCSNPAGTGGGSVPVGLVVATDSGTLLVVHGTSASENFRVKADDDTPVFTVTFTDGKGQSLDISGSTMEGDMESPVVAGFEATSDGAFSGRIHGKLVGLTRLRFKLYDGPSSSGQLRYTSPWIPVVVAP